MNIEDKNKKPHKVTFSIRMEQNLVEKIRRGCKIEHRPVSMQIELIVEKWLKELEKQEGREI